MHGATQCKMYSPPLNRPPGWVSPRRQLEQSLSELCKRPNLRLLRQTHARLLKLNLHSDPSVAHLLVSAYSLSHHLPSALSAFSHVPLPTPRLFNSLLRALSLHPNSLLSFSALRRMLTLGLSPDNFTFPFLIKASSSDLPRIRVLHTHILKWGFLADVYVPNSLIEAYSRCGPTGVAAARQVFDGMPLKDVVSWNSMIAGLARCGELEEAREVFDEMPQRDVISWNTLLDGCAGAGDMDAAFDLFGRMPERNVVSWTTMVSGYCKKGDMETARMLFDKMPVRNLVTWTIIVSGYAKKGLGREAEVLFERMLLQAGTRVDSAAVISILAACAESGLLCLGRKVHDCIRKVKLKSTTQMCNAVLDMYAKCGLLDEAWRVFEGMSSRDRVSWNSMIHCLAVHGHGERALRLFSEMMDQRIAPDGVTFIAVLCACTHVGLVKEGRNYFVSMERDYGIAPQIEHFGCMVDLLGRGGLLNEAFDLISSMPFTPSAIIYGSLLSACRTHNNVELAEVVLEKCMELDASDPGVYAIMSNIYATTKRWEGMAKVRLQMKDVGVQKPSGSSFIEVESVVHEFTVADNSHPQTTRIMQMLERLGDDLRQAGYVPKAQFAIS